MIAVDTNVLVAAHRRDAAGHERAAGAVRKLAEGNGAWAIPWPCIHEFVAIVTHPRIFDPPSPMSDTVRQVDLWLASPSVVTLSERDGYWRELAELLLSSGVSGDRAHDGRIAALCRHHGVTELLTADRDFGRFPGLRTRNPLV